MNPKIQELERKHAKAVQAERVREQLQHERAEVRRQTLAQIGNQVDFGDHGLAIASDFSFASDAVLTQYRVASYAPEPTAAGDYFSNPGGTTGNYYQRTVSGRPDAILLAPGEEPPSGFVVDEAINFAEIRRGAEEARARTNAVRAANNGSGMIPGSSVDPNAGTSPDGFGLRRDERTGEEIAELRPAPMSEQQLVESALAEIPGLLADFPDEAVAEAIGYIREFAAQPERLSLVAATQQLVEGPEPGSLYAWRRLQAFDPAVGFPKNEPGTRCYTLRRIFELASRRRDARLTYGGVYGSDARNPFGDQL